MKEDKYIAYVGTYTHGSSEGIHIFDMDIPNGIMKERKVIPVNNPSHVRKSPNGRYLYSIADEGVEVFAIQPDGDLVPMNKVGIEGMRGCYLATDLKGKYLFVAGYHDGKITVIQIEKDGRLGKVKEGIFHKGLGSVAERNFRPHVTCVKATPDDKYMCAVDNGIDQVKIYKVNQQSGKLHLIDILRCELESGPRLLKFSADGRHAYLICELSNEINVYSYDGSGENPRFELIQTVPTSVDSNDDRCAAAGMKFTRDGEYLYCSSAGDNTVSIFKVDISTGLLNRLCIFPISGNYPKDIDIFPDSRHFVALNHESNEIRTFKVDYDQNIFIMKGRPIHLETPNCMLIMNLADRQ